VATHLQVTVTAATSLGYVDPLTAAMVFRSSTSWHSFVIKSLSWLSATSNLSMFASELDSSVGQSSTCMPALFFSYRDQAQQASSILHIHILHLCS
jgi:hypothetical protein